MDVCVRRVCARGSTRVVYRIRDDAMGRRTRRCVAPMCGAREIAREGLGACVVCVGVSVCRSSSFARARVGGGGDDDARR